MTTDGGGFKGLRWTRDDGTIVTLRSTRGDRSSPSTARRRPCRSRCDDAARLAVSFLLEEDRARAFDLRQPVVDPAEGAGRRTWSRAGHRRRRPSRLPRRLGRGTEEGLDHRRCRTRSRTVPRTAGARLSRDASDEIHRAGRPTRGDPSATSDLVTRRSSTASTSCSAPSPSWKGAPTLGLRAGVPRAGGRCSGGVGTPARAAGLRPRAVLADVPLLAQRTGRHARRRPQVRRPARDAASTSDWPATAARRRRTAPHAGRGRVDRAGAAGGRVATVRRRHPVVLLHRAGRRWSRTRGDADDPEDQLQVRPGARSGGSRTTATTTGLLWSPGVAPTLEVGDRVVLAEAEWLSASYKSGHEFAVSRPTIDGLAAPQAGLRGRLVRPGPGGPQVVLSPARRRRGRVVRRRSPSGAPRAS